MQMWLLQTARQGKEYISCHSEWQWATICRFMTFYTDNSCKQPGKVGNIPLATMNGSGQPFVALHTYKDNSYLTHYKDNS